jgi:hypothetical protein
VLVTESTDELITGYEVRVGNIVRQPADAPIRSYLRRKIAKIRQMRISQKRESLIISKGPEKSTLQRVRLYDYLFAGA